MRIYFIFISYMLCNLSYLSNAFVNINIYGTGLYLPYSMGVIGYIKNNIPIKNYNITGISGGAWCSLLYTQETDLSNHDTIWDYSIGKDVSHICIHNDMRVFQNNVEKNMKLRYSNKEPLNLDKISIISTNINKIYNIKNEKHSNFDNINDLIEFCLCSSYIPYISGSTFSKKYKDNYYIDGEIKNDKYAKLNNEKNTINIDRFMWGRQFTRKELLYLDKDKSRELFNNGWEDTESNKEKIMNILNDEDENEDKINNK